MCRGGTCFRANVANYSQQQQCDSNGDTTKLYTRVTEAKRSPKDDTFSQRNHGELETLPQTTHDPNEACIAYHHTRPRAHVVGSVQIVQDNADLVKVEPALPDVLQVVTDEAYYVADPLFLQIQASRLGRLQISMCVGCCALFPSLPSTTVLWAHFTCWSNTADRLARLVVE